MYIPKNTSSLIFYPLLKQVSFFGVLVSLIVAWTLSLDETSVYNPDTTDDITSVVLDVSLSMNVLDGNDSQDSRLVAAKMKILEIITDVPGKFGLTVFSGNPQRIIPYTADKNLFLTFLGSVDRENVAKGGTSIELAIRDALNDFIEDTSGNIILFTDGGEESLRNVEELKKILTQKNIEIYIIGVGTKEGGYIPYAQDVFGRVSYKTYNGKRVVATLGERGLHDLADNLGGKYYHISDISDVGIFAPTLNKSNPTNAIPTSILWAYIAFGFWLYLLVHMYMYKNVFGYKIGKK